MDFETEEQNEEVFKTMVNELLAEVRYPSSDYSEVQVWVQSLLKVVTRKCGVKEEKNLRRTIKDSIKFPLPKDVLRHSKEYLKKFRWIAPERVEVIGSWATKTAVRNLSSVDILVEIPKECFVKSDVLNHKYHAKRVAYLAVLAKRLMDRGYSNLAFVCPDGVKVTPALRIPVNQSLHAVVYVVPPIDIFEYNKRLLPSKNNLRYGVFYPEETCTEEESCARSTPHYNLTIAKDVLRTTVNEKLSETICSNRVLQDVVILLKVWLKQRSLHEGYGAFSGFLASVVVSKLYDNGTLHNTLSVYQMLRLVFSHLTNIDWDHESSEQSAMVAEWKKNCDAVYLDDSELLNFAAGMSKLTIERIRREARLALRNLTCTNFYNFRILFMKPVAFLQTFDHILQLRLPQPLQEVIGKEKLKWQLLDHSGDQLPVTMKEVEMVLLKALKNRIEVAGVEISPCPVWDVSSKPVYQKTELQIRLGWVIRPEEAHKQVEKCDSSNESAVQDFKEFWSGKSELRRFRDGSISESVVFTKDKRRICHEMVFTSLEHHLKLSLENSLSYLDVQIETLLEPYYEKMIESVVSTKEDKLGKKRKLRKTKLETVTVHIDEVSSEANNAFDKLGKILRAADLPLAITTIQGLSPILRGTNPFPGPSRMYIKSENIVKRSESIKRRVLINDSVDKSKQLLLPKVPELSEPIYVQVQLEHNNKWPDDIKAVNRLKCAMLIRLATTLTGKYNLASHPSPYYVDVLLDGFIFRVVLLCGKEILLYKTIKHSDGLETTKETEDSQALEKEGVHLPKLTTTLHTFSLRHSCYGRVVHLAKRWVASHLMLNYPLAPLVRLDPNHGLSEEAVELLVANLFLNHQPFLAPPHETQVGFLRFLEMIATTDWQTVPIFVNFNDGLSASEMQNIERSFHKSRTHYPPLTIITPYDKSGSIWTKGTFHVILNRLSALAKTSLSYLTVILQDQLEQEEKLFESVSKIYLSPKDHYDAVIWLKKDFTARAYQYVHSMKNPVLKFRSYTHEEDETLPVIGFDPVRIYMQQLNNAFGHIAVFLNDTYGGNMIAVIWKPDATSNKEFSVTSSRGRIINDDQTLQVDGDATLESMKLLGGELVDRTEQRKF